MLLMSDYHLPVNIGNPHEISILDFAQEIIELTGTDQKIVFKSLPKNDPLQRKPDITKAKELLGWEPNFGRKEGMQRTYTYFKSLTEEELKKVEHRDFTSFKS